MRIQTGDVALAQDKLGSFWIYVLGSTSVIIVLLYYILRLHQKTLYYYSVRHRKHMRAVQEESIAGRLRRRQSQLAYRFKLNAFGKGIELMAGASRIHSQSHAWHTVKLDALVQMLHRT